jgi:NAD(P)-dependent dehydrogenase (short-subunit alcohol dehydrogenase family)
LSNDEKKEANAQKHPMKKIGTPEDVAQMAAFLLSDQSSWMTGQILSLDGGMSSIK